MTSALEPGLVGEVLGLVRDLKKQGMTPVMATHEMGFVRQVADRVCFLDRGVVLASRPAAYERHCQPLRQRARGEMSAWVC